MSLARVQGRREALAAGGTLRPVVRLAVGDPPESLWKKKARRAAGTPRGGHPRRVRNQCHAPSYWPVSPTWPPPASPERSAQPTGAEAITG